MAKSTITGLEEAIEQVVEAFDLDDFIETYLAKQVIDSIYACTNVRLLKGHSHEQYSDWLKVAAYIEKGAMEKITRQFFTERYFHKYPQQLEMEF